MGAAGASPAVAGDTEDTEEAAGIRAMAVEAAGLLVAAAEDLLADFLVVEVGGLLADLLVVEADTEEAADIPATAVEAGGLLAGRLGVGVRARAMATAKGAARSTGSTTGPGGTTRS